jgi:hypothetical protein
VAVLPVGAAFAPAGAPAICPVTWTSFPTSRRKSLLSPMSLYLFPVLSVRVKIPLAAEPDKHPFKVLPEAFIPD